MDFKEEINIDEQGKILLEKAREAINMEQGSLNRDAMIRQAMTELYAYFSSYPEEELSKFGLQLEIFKIERMLKNEFLPLRSQPIFNPNSDIEYPDEISSQQTCEQALDYLVHCTRMNLSKHNDLNTASLEKQCLDTSYHFEKICEEKNIELLHLGLDQNLNNGMFHHFTIVNLPIGNGEKKPYIVDCTYRQFFIKSNSFIERISATRGVAAGSSIGAYMMMTDERKKMSEQLLTKGYIEATPENLKQYLDSIVFSGRGNDYYVEHGLDYMNPNDCIPEYTIADYMRMLTANRVISSNTFLRGIESPVQEQDKECTIDTSAIGKRTIETDTKDKGEITSFFANLKKRIKEIGIFK